jgi:hypothetical protein
MEKQLPTSSPHRVAFYPCCAGDIEEPRLMLAPFVDEIIFCDLRRSRIWDDVVEIPGLPQATFLQGDAREMLQELPPLTVLFYRIDGMVESGSGLRIVGKEMLPRILSRFDPAGGWIFSDGSNGGKTFRLLCSPDWHPKPSWGFQFREVDQSSMKLENVKSIHVVEVRPLTMQPPVMRAGWVPPLSDPPKTIDTLWDYCTANNRLVPMPPQWSKLYDMLKNTRQKPSGGWEPPLPLILGAWHHSMPIEKQLRFKEHLAWAQSQDQLDQITSFLYSLTENQWCHFGEI